MNWAFGTVKLKKVNSQGKFTSNLCTKIFNMNIFWIITLNTYKIVMRNYQLFCNDSVVILIFHFTLIFALQIYFLPLCKHSFAQYDVANGIKILWVLPLSSRFIFYSHPKFGFQCIDDSLIWFSLFRDVNLNLPWALKES